MARKPEAVFWDWLEPFITTIADVQRHEDKYSVGVPDLSYGIDGINGWIELKACSKWPSKGLPYFTAKQANWLTDRGKTGGHCFILVRISDMILIFSWEKAHILRETVLESDAIKIWNGYFSTSELLEVLTRNEYR